MPTASSSRCCRADRARPRVVAADLAFDCTGFRPDLDQPLIASLFKRDLARPDPHHLGLAVDRNGQVIGASGASFGLFAIGPLCQGTLWEITAVPEIVAQSDRAAQALAILARGGGGNGANPGGGLLMTVGAGVNLSLWLTVRSPQKATKRRKINMFPAGREARGH